MIRLLRDIIQKDLFQQFSWYASSQVLLQVASFINVVVISRYLGPINVGLLSFVQNYLGVFTAILVAPDFYFSWQIAKSENKTETLAQYVRYKMALAIPLLIAGLAGAWSVLPADVSRLATIMMVALVAQPLTAFTIYATANGFAKRIGLVQVTATTVLVFAKLILVYLEAPLTYFAVAAMLDVALSTVIVAYLFLKDPTWQRAMEHIRPSRLTHAISFLYSVRYSIIAFLAWQYILRIDQLLLATLVDAHSLGIYSAAVKIAEVPNFIGGAIYTALIAKMAIAANGVDKISKSNLRKALAVYFWVGLGVMVGIYICAPVLVSILYGAQFIEAVPVLKAYALSIPALFIGFFFLAVYGAREKHGVQIVITLIALAANVVLLYVLTPHLGLAGAAYSTDIAYTFAVVAFYFHIRKTLIE